MSIDITYFAFHPKRADVRWSELENLDLERIADTHQTKREIKESLNNLEKKMRSAETAEAYLKEQGIESPSDITLFNTRAALERGEIAWSPSISEADIIKKQTLEKQLAELPIIPLYLDDTNLLFGLWPRKTTLSWMSQEPKSTEECLDDLIGLDLAFGSVSTYLSDPNNEERFLTALFYLFMPEAAAEERVDMEHLLSEKIVPLFEKMSKQKIYQALDEASEELLQTIEITSDDLEWFPDALIDFAFEIRPIAKDIKDTGSRLVIAGGGTELEDTELNERAEKRLQSLFSRFPWMEKRLNR